MQLPSVTIGCGGDSTSSEDDLRFGEHGFPRREDGAIRDEEVLCNVGIGYNDESLVSQRERVQSPKFFRPVVECKFGVLGQERERPWTENVNVGLVHKIRSLRVIPTMGNPIGPSGIGFPCLSFRRYEKALAMR